MQLLRGGQSIRYVRRPPNNPSIYQGTSSISMIAFDNEELAPPSLHRLGRPFFAKLERHEGSSLRGRQSLGDPAVLRRLRQGSNRSEEKIWLDSIAPRLVAAGFTWNDASNRKDAQQPLSNADHSINVLHPIWRWPMAVRLACQQAMLGPPSLEIAARKLCAKTKDTRYPSIYQSLDYQAHFLYALGLLELERDSQWRPLAHFMLSISAGLGQIDAAILLHQLHKIDKQFTLQIEQRAVIVKAARDRLDWRAMVAHVEYVASQIDAGTRRAPVLAAAGTSNDDLEQLARLEGPQLEECLNLLREAMSLTSPSPRALQRVTTKPSNTSDIDTATLGIMNPPYKLLYNLTRAQLHANNSNPTILEHLEQAMQVGALEYRDPEMAAAYVQHFLTEHEGKRSKIWLECANLAALNLNPETCLVLSEHHLKTEGWYPSLTAKVLDDYERREQESSEANATTDAESDRFGRGSDKDTEQEKHDKIMAQKDKSLLASQEGFKWMRIAAQLNLKSATKMVNRYCIIAGLLRQNGFPEEGRAVLLEAREDIKLCVGTARETKRAQAVLDEYLEYWDQGHVQDMLTPKVITGLLERAKRR